MPSDRLVYGGIEGMLKTLDPHSSFFDPRQYAQMRERQEGKYYGLGIQIQPIDGDITVMSIFEGSPAFKKGLRRGDVIARIEQEDAKGMSSEDAVKRLKGPKGTSVNVSIKRRGYDQLIPLQVTRDEVNIVSVRGVFMIDNETGYLKLGEFTETSNHEVGAGLDLLMSKGMKRLVFDLRDNPGGALDQAIAISNRFLPRGDMIVYTRGRSPNSDQDYRATEQSDFTHLPMVVLVNRNSASASEIVSGALQDHDRALVSARRLSARRWSSRCSHQRTAGLALTTGHYYTPSGRLIQRPWDGTFDEYLTYTLRDQKGAREHNAADLKYTEAGRKVYSGGGIEPDKFMAGPVEGFSPTKFGRQIWGSGQFQRFADQYLAEGDTRFSDANKNKKRIRQGLRGVRRNAAGLPCPARDANRRRRRGLQDRPRLRQIDDSLRDRSGPLRRRGSAPQPHSSGPAGPLRPQSVRRSAAPDGTHAEHAAHGWPIEPTRAFGPQYFVEEFALAPSCRGLLD